MYMAIHQPDVIDDGPRDATGRLIRVGDRITYPGRTGSSLYVTVATVDEIRQSGKGFKLRVRRISRGGRQIAATRNKYWSESKYATLERTENVTVVL